MLIKRACLLADEAAVGGVGYAAGGVPDGITQGSRGAGFLAEVALSAGGSSKPMDSICSVYSFCSFYRAVYHYFPEVHHAAEGVVYELVVAPDEA